MKTGRLLKFQRPGADVHAYIYRDGGAYRAALYLMSPAPGRQGEPVHSVSGPTEDSVEEGVRAWVEVHFPRPG